MAVVSRSRAWGWAQGAVLLATAAFVAAVLARPQPSMTLFWNVVVPLLPLSFLLTPVVWRSICPLATLNMLVSWPGGRKLSGQVSRWAGLPSMLALAVLVPLRHLAFNTEPWALVLLIAIAAAAAVASGMLFDARAGFCNLVCPVLPVERLYGQRPVIDVGNPRCASCSVCTPRGCPDLALEKALPQLMGSVFSNFPSSNSCRARSNEGSRQCWLVSTSVANELQDNGEHSALVLTEKVNTS